MDQYLTDLEAEFFKTENGGDVRIKIDEKNTE